MSVLTIVYQPGGWILVLLAVFLLGLGYWALLNMAGGEDERHLRMHPEILEDERRQQLEALFRTSYPNFLPTAPDAVITNPDAKGHR